MENPEVHPPHRRLTGLPRWLELVIALTALVTSISSIAIAVHHSRILEQLVQANSMPYMQGGFSDITPEGARVLSLDLLNRGVGPAHQTSLGVKANGAHVTSLNELFLASLGAETVAEAGSALIVGIGKNRVRTRFIPGGQKQQVFFMPRTPENARYWDLLEASQPNWDVEYCYCSVFEECWRSPGKWHEPVKVKACERDEPNEFLP